MSGIAGIWHLDGRPVERAALARMTAALAHRGPHGRGLWLDGPVGLGHVALHTTPEAAHERQPLLNEAGTVCLVLDGRVDNREELRGALGAAGARLRTDTDAELVLRAYERWREECLDRIAGDFALAVWDEPERRLFCARDPLGVRPLYYYHADGRSVVLASEVRPLLEHPAVPRRPNEAMVAEYLAAAVTDREETLYQGIRRLPPAHHLVARADGLRTRRYWPGDRLGEIRYRTDREYAEHFREVFTEAVRCRLRSHRPVGVLLSGGLDSSSVVGVAQALARRSAPPHPSLEAFSLVFPGEACDETGYVEDVARMWGLESHRRPDGAATAPYAEQAQRYQDIPDYPNGAMADPLKVLARDRGVRVLLSGVGGDEWLTGTWVHCADLVRRLRLVELARRVRLDARARGGRAALGRVVGFGLRPLVPWGARRAIRLALGREPAPRWIRPELVRRTRLLGRLHAGRPPDGPRGTLAQRELLRVAAGGWAAHAAEMEDRSASGLGLEQRHPFQDRRVADFGLALPEDQRWRQGQTKFVLRQALEGLLPETVRLRRSKAEFSLVLARALRAQGRACLLSPLETAAMGWVDEAEVRRMYGAMVEASARADEGYQRHVWPLWMVFALELWLRAAFPGRDGLRARELHARTA